jgi:hypothetical protein
VRVTRIGPNNDSNGKPFVYDELVARMRAVLRRSNGPRHPRLTVRDLEIDLASRVVTLAGQAVQLSAKEYELLVAPAEDPERVFKKEELLRSVWGFRSLAARGRWTLMPRGCGASSTARPRPPTSSTSGEWGTAWSRRLVKARTVSELLAVDAYTVPARNHWKRHR